jgi:hypothetical protein
MSHRAVLATALVFLAACNSQPPPTPAQEPTPQAGQEAPKAEAGKQYGAAFTVAATEALASAVARLDKGGASAAAGASSAAAEHSCGSSAAKFDAASKEPKVVDSCGSAVVDDDGQVVRVTGTVAAVCQKAGCWMTLQDGAAEARIFTREHKFFMPKDIVGKRAEVEGKLRSKTVTAAFAKHLAEDGGKDPSRVEGPQREYLVTATGVRVFD